MNLNTIVSEPAYISGAFFSQAPNLTRKLDRAKLQETCFLAVVATFIKKEGATCYASPETLLSIYNKHSHKFGLKPIRRSTLFTIQKRVINSGLIINTLEHDAKKGRNWRRFSLNVDLIAMLFSSVINQAFHRANALLQRKLDANRSQENTTKKSSSDAGSSAVVESQNQTRTTKESKDLRRNKNKPNGTFFKKRFGKDCDKAYQLQEQARNGSISAGGAKLLMKLHHQYGVFLAPAFKSFLNFRIFNAPKQPASQTAVQRSQQRIQAIIESRQGNQMAIEPELLALVAERPEPTRTQASKQQCRNILEQRKAAQVVAAPQPVALPAYITDSNAIAAGESLRRRIQQKINQ